MKRWLSELQKDIKTWTWSKNKLVCSNHFRSDDFIVKGGRNTLKCKAVPFVVKVERCLDIIEPCTSKSWAPESTISESSTNHSKTSSGVKKEVATKVVPKPIKRKLRFVFIYALIIGIWLLGHFM